jgi:CRP-like cAMP-binding protein
MRNPVLAMVANIIPLSKTLERAISNNLTFIKTEKKDILLKEGEICDYLYFVKKGLLRSYYEKDDQDITNWFLMENDLAISLLSFYRRQPSFETIEALEDCELYSIHYDALMALYAKYPIFNTVGRVLTEEYYCRSEEKTIGLRRQSAAEKYADFMIQSPELFNRVPKKYIASYLGVTTETLSRIKAYKS